VRLFLIMASSAACNQDAAAVRPVLEYRAAEEEDVCQEDPVLEYRPAEAEDLEIEQGAEERLAAQEEEEVAEEELEAPGSEQEDAAREYELAMASAAVLAKENGDLEEEDDDACFSEALGEQEVNAEIAAFLCGQRDVKQQDETEEAMVLEAEERQVQLLEAEAVRLAAEVRRATLSEDEDKEDEMPCKRRRVGEQGEAVPGSDKPKPMLHRLKSKVFKDEEVAQSIVPTEVAKLVSSAVQQSRMAVFGGTAKVRAEQHILAPLKRAYVWLQGTFAGRRSSSQQESLPAVQIKEQQAKQVELSRRHINSEKAAILGA